MSLNETSIINKIKNLKNEVAIICAGNNSISEIEKVLLKEGLKDYEQGKIHTHKQVMNELKEKYGL